MFAQFDKIFTVENMIYLGKGAVLSIVIAAISLLVGLVLGVIAYLGKTSQKSILRWLANIYIEVIRGTPMLLQIMMLFTVIPAAYTAITGGVLRINPILIGIIAMSINSGAYSAELIRSGINGVDKGQWEACETLGLTHWQMMKLVILPQAFKRIIPPIISEFITLIKDSSLISTIGAIELLNSAQILGVTYFDVTTPYLMAMIYYLIMTIGISYIGKKIEGKLAVSD